MRFTLIAAAAGIIMLLAGAWPGFLPAFLIVGYLTDRQRRQQAQ